MQNLKTLISHVPKLKIGDVLLSHYRSDYSPGIPQIKSGSYYLISDIKNSIFHYEKNPHPKVYVLILCSKNGKPYKQDHHIDCYSIDEKLDLGQFTLIK